MNPKPLALNLCLWQSLQHGGVWIFKEGDPALLLAGWDFIRRIMQRHAGSCTL